MTTVANPSSVVRAEVPNDLAAFWMPFTAEPRLQERSAPALPRQGMHYWTPDGREILDATPELWCVNAGHDRAPIVAAIQLQASIDFAPTFQFAHPLAFQLASRLAALAPGDSTTCSSPIPARSRSTPRSRSRIAYQNVRGQARDSA